MHPRQGRDVRVRRLPRDNDRLGAVRDPPPRTAPARPRTAPCRAGGGGTRHSAAARCRRSSTGSCDINILLLETQIKYPPRTPTLDHAFKLKVTFCVRCPISSLLVTGYVPYLFDV